MRLVVLVSADGGEVAKVTIDGEDVPVTRHSIEFNPAARDGRGAVVVTLELPGDRVLAGEQPAT